MNKILIALSGAMALSACAEVNEIRDQYEDATASREFLAVKQACNAGDMDACGDLVQARAARSQASAIRYQTTQAASVPSNSSNGNAMMRCSSYGRGVDLVTGACM